MNKRCLKMYEVHVEPPYFLLWAWLPMGRSSNAAASRLVLAALPVRVVVGWLALLARNVLQAR
jgi:hypothetical protein